MLSKKKKKRIDIIYIKLIYQNEKWAFIEIFLKKETPTLFPKQDYVHSYIKRERRGGVLSIGNFIFHLIPYQDPIPIICQIYNMYHSKQICDMH